MKKFMSKNWKWLLIIFGIAVLMFFVRQCQIDRIMKKGEKRDLKYQQTINELDEKIQNERDAHQKTRDAKAELRKEYEILKSQKPRVVVKYVKGKDVDPHENYILKQVFENAQVTYEDYISDLIQNHERYVEQDLKGEKETDMIIWDLQREVFTLKNQVSDLQKDRLKLYNKAKGWLWLGYSFGWDPFNDSWFTGPTVTITLVRLK